ncbi:MAG: Hydroxymethylglutaryl-CoA reductase, partial [uncultured Gemmatimonadetes bacterium]
ADFPAPRSQRHRPARPRAPRGRGRRPADGYVGGRAPRSAPRSRPARVERRRARPASGVRRGAGGGDPAPDGGCAARGRVHDAREHRELHRDGAGARGAGGAAAGERNARPGRLLRSAGDVRGRAGGQPRPRRAPAGGGGRRRVPDDDRAGAARAGLRLRAHGPGGAFRGVGRGRVRGAAGGRVAHHPPRTAHRRGHAHRGQPRLPGVRLSHGRRGGPEHGDVLHRRAVRGNPGAHAGAAALLVPGKQHVGRQEGHGAFLHPGARPQRDRRGVHPPRAGGGRAAHHARADVRLLAGGLRRRGPHGVHRRERARGQRDRGAVPGVRPGRGVRQRGQRGRHPAGGDGRGRPVRGAQPAQPDRRFGRWRHAAAHRAGVPAHHGLPGRRPRLEAGGDLRGAHPGGRAFHRGRTLLGRLRAGPCRAGPRLAGPM